MFRGIDQETLSSIKQRHLQKVSIHSFINTRRLLEISVDF